MKRLLSIGIILLFIGLSISSSTGHNANLSVQPLSSGNTLYVGGSGPGNYTRIQDAIDDASDGDTVFVYEGIYYEYVLINKRITLNGEDKHNTIVEGGGVPRIAVFKVYPLDVINVNISNFTIRNTPGQQGIHLNSGNNTITNCIFYNLHHGIYMSSDNNSIINCICYNTFAGINIVNGNNNRLFNCQIYSNEYSGISINGNKNKISNCNIYSTTGETFHNGKGIYFDYANDNDITNCNISKNQVGIWLANSHNNYIYWCDFYNNSITGISARTSTVNNFIDGNNFIRNTINAEDYSNNSWGGYYMHGGNFWSDYNGSDYERGINQSIPGSDGIGDKPYNISGLGNNIDRYPLMSPKGSPFQILYLGEMDVLFRKESRKSGGGGLGAHSKVIYLKVNLSIDELPLTIVYYFTVEMNYSLKFPFLFAPLFAIGLRIRNHSDYSWEFIKLLHNGKITWYGQVEQEINLNLTGFKKDDELGLYVDIPVITPTHPWFDSPGHNESWKLLLRLVFNIPILNDVLLRNWLLPILAPYNLLFSSGHDHPTIFLRFI